MVALLGKRLAAFAAVVAAAVVTVDGATRTYYLQAEELEWDYVPYNTNLIHCTPLEVDAMASVFTHSGYGYIGKVYKKAVFRAYTDSTFTTQLPRDEAMGTLGPPLRAEVNDTLKVVFKNAASMPYSVHPHGVLYNRNNEGANYNNMAGTGSSVAPGDMYTYSWDVPDRAGPSADDTACILWAYHSHVMPEFDVYAGLIGPLVICKGGVLDANNQPTDVDREVFSYFNVDDESNSHYLEQNLEAYAQPIKNYKGAKLLDLVEDEDFAESNLMHNINGFMYGNNMDVLCKGQKVRWYLIAFGTEVDLHTAHWHGLTVLSDGHRMDVIELLPATFRTVEMNPDAIGQWVFHCHVNDHNMAGMSAFFSVLDEADPRCNASQWESPATLNAARQSLLDSTMARCQPHNADYTMTIPTPQPLGKIGDETYMKSEYDEWMEGLQPVLRNLPAYGQFLRCPMPQYCLEQHYKTTADHSTATALWYSLASAACTAVGALVPFLPGVTPDNTMILAAFMGTAAGVMVWIAIGELFVEGNEYMCCSTPQYKLAALGLFFCGVFGTILLDILVHWVEGGLKIRGKPMSAYLCRRRKGSADDKRESTGAVCTDTAEVVRASESGSPRGSSIRRVNSNANLGELASDTHSSKGKLNVNAGPEDRAVIDLQGADADEALVDDDDNGKPGSVRPVLSDEERERIKRMGILTGLAIALHNFPEGVATYVSASASTQLGLTMAIAIGLHNIPEGFLVAMPIYFATGSKWKAFMWASMSGLFEFFGAVMTWLVFGDNLSSLFFGIVFSWIAGMVIFLALTHILPMGYAYDPYHGKFVGLFGFIGIFIMGIAMGISGES